MDARRAAAWAAEWAAVVLLLAACSRGGRSSGPADPGRAQSLLLSGGEVPAGYQARPDGPGTKFNLDVCGAPLEAGQPVSAAETRFAKSEIGPFLAQYVRVYDGDQARRDLDGLAAALPGCKQYRSTTESGAEVTFTVRPLSLPTYGDQSVAFEQTSSGDTPVTSQVVALRVGKVRVLLVSYGLRGPDRDGLAAAATAAAAKAGRTP